LITADGEFHPTDLPRFLAAIEAADLVAALVPNRTIPLYRTLLSWGWRTCMQAVLGECPRLEGTFMIRNEVFRRFEVTSRSGMFRMELLIKARRAGPRIVNTVF
jgi:hypothetical protein